MRITALATLLLLVCIGQVNAQPVWEGGFFVGGASYQGDLVQSQLPELKELGPAGGLFARFYFDPSWSLRTNLLYARFSGSDQNADDPAFRKRDFSFESQAGELAVLFEWDPLGKRRYPGGAAFRKTFSPFLFAGVGLGYFDPDPDFGVNGGDLPAGVREDLAADYDQFRFSVPAGVGVKWDLGRNLTLSGLIDVRYMFTDYLDGISKAANPDNNDWLWTGGLQLSWRFSKKDSDGDGIVDKEDACPWLAGDATAGGCPDTDGDGIEDAEDLCPETFGLFPFNGCPDTDGDGLMDPADDCPGEAGSEETGGCPDRDQDSIPDAVDKCPDQEGDPQFEGCPDSDGDGIPDPTDTCPQTAGPVENGGCPYPDTDGDGIPDKDDDCPRLEGGGHPSGCPDMDGDGIADNLDRCPDVAGSAANSGCPELREEEKALLSGARSNVRFQTGKATLLPASKEVLDEIVQIMRKYPHFHLNIKGYTDSTGNDQNNLRLSEDRAESCYQYLLFQGVGANRMSHQGFGEADPIGDNNTEEGKRLNRRVEFEIFLPDN